MLYAITDSKLLSENLLEKCEAALQGGCQWLQYRDKSNDSEKRQHEARALQALCQRYNAKLIINDDLQLAIDCDADGLHLGQGDGCVITARKTLGPDKIIGVTCHDQIALAQTAIQQGASYIAFGRFFPSATKPNAQPAPLSLLGEAQNQFCNPIVAIGGITTDNATQVYQAGASVIAVCHSLFACDNVKAQAQRFIAQRTKS